VSVEDDARPFQPPVPGLVVEYGGERTVVRVSDGWVFAAWDGFTAATARSDEWTELIRDKRVQIVRIPPPEIEMRIWYEGCLRTVVGVPNGEAAISVCGPGSWCIPKHRWTPEHVVVLYAPTQLSILADATVSMCSDSVSSPAPDTQRTPGRRVIGTCRECEFFELFEGDGIGFCGSADTERDAPQLHEQSFEAGFGCIHWREKAAPAPDGVNP
jgi:hypothetical protein